MDGSMSVKSRKVALKNTIPQYQISTSRYNPYRSFDPTSDKFPLDAQTDPGDFRDC